MLILGKEWLSVFSVNKWVVLEYEALAAVAQVYLTPELFGHRFQCGQCIYAMGDVMDHAASLVLS